MLSRQKTTVLWNIKVYGSILLFCDKPFLLKNSAASCGTAMLSPTEYNINYPKLNIDYPKNLDNLISMAYNINAKGINR